MLRLPLFLMVMVAGLLLSFGGAFATGAKGTSKSKSSIQYVPAAFYVQGGCDIADIQAQAVSTDKSGPFPKWQLHAARLLDTRIETCTEIIHNWMTSAAVPVPVISPERARRYGLPALFIPADHCRQLKSNDPVREYAMLHYCVSWIGRYVPAVLPTPTMAPISGPSPFKLDPYSTWHKYIYVLALASDAPTSAQIAYRLRDAVAVVASPSPDVYTDRPVALSLVAYPAVTLQAFQQMCYSDPSVAGAIVALPPSTQGNTWNAAVIAAAWTTVAWQTLVFDCKPTNTSYVNNALYLEWAARIESGKATSYGIPVASALAVLAGIQAWPGNSTASNGAAATLAAVGVAALTPLTSVVIGQGTEADGQLAAAIDKAVPRVASALLSPCLSPTLNGAASSASPSLNPSPPPIQCSWITQKQDNH